MSLKDEMNQADKEVGKGNSSYFSFEDRGSDKIRVLTHPEAIGSHFFGKGSKPATCYGKANGCPFHGVDPKSDKGEDYKVAVKYVCYILDRKDGGVKIADLPYSVVKKMASLEDDEDYAFTTYPMPYDLKISLDKSKSPADMYTINPAPNRTEVTDEQMSVLAEKMSSVTPLEIIQKKKDATMKEHQFNGIWISPEKLAEEDKIRREKFIEEAKIHNAEVAKNKSNYPSAEEAGIDENSVPFED